MSNYTRLVNRSGTYAHWMEVNAQQSARGGLKLAKGEWVCVIADELSASVGLSLPDHSPQLKLPAQQRLAAPGEILGWKSGEGDGLPFDLLPWFFPYYNINISNGRVLGTQTSGQAHQY